MAAGNVAAQGEAVGQGSRRATGHMRLGQVLVEERVITKRELRKGLAGQKSTGRSLGHTLVELGITTEEEIITAFNRRYGATLSSLADDLDDYLRSQGIKSEGKRSGIRLPIKAKLSLGVIFIIWVTILGLSFLILTRQRDQLYQQTVKTGKVSLNYIVNNARIPLINENVLQLNTLVKETASVEGVLYAVIVDRNDIVQAHTDPGKIRKKREDIQGVSETTQEEGYGYFNYLNSAGTHILEMTTPVTFRDKALGQVSVGISLDFINDQIARETLFIVALSLLIIVLGIVIAILMGVGFARPISALVMATQEIGLGNLRYKIKKIRNDEFGDLASAFNFMSDELLKKALMQESFGKYVGSEVLDMIMEDPENAWLKGTRSDVSILFTDIRGFTSFSEDRSPEEIVEALNSYFDIATRAIQNHGGYVDKFIGDAVMGVFGAPIFHPHHAEQAVRAALDMQAEFATEAKIQNNEVLAKVGIGINAGPVVSGNIGSQDKVEYTVIGDTVNVASRLNGLAKSGETVVSKAVADAIGDKLTVKPLPPQKVKGKTELQEVFKVTAITGTAPARQAVAKKAPVSRSSEGASS